MEQTANLLQRAIAAARAGRRIEARDMLVELVESEPRNEMAWIWLSGLVDSLDDKIIACENALTINPDNERVRAYLSQLLAQRPPAPPPDEHTPPFVDEKPEPAGRQAEDPKPSGLVLRTRDEVKRFDFPETELGPLDLAKQCEAEGQYEEALKLLTNQAGVTTDKAEFDRIYREITRIEMLRAEKIAHISPTKNIVRMTISWPLVYLSLALVQMGMNPFSAGAWKLWLGLPIVALGSFLMALAEVRSRHAVWRAVFAEHTSEGSVTARMVATVAGWILVVAPHLLMLADSLVRLQNFKIP